MARAPEPLRLILVIAVTLIVLIRVGVWLRQDALHGPKPQGASAIAGRVVDEHDAPVREAQVRLYAGDTNTTWSAVTDGSGRFSFTSLPAADKMNLSASLSGYLSAYFSIGAGTGTTPIDLGDGERMKDVVLRLRAASSISGVVYDEHGKPASGRYVRALWSPRRGGGAQTLLPTGELGAIDAQGRYTIGNLEPGDYIVSLAAAPGASHARVFGPGTLTLSQAGVITVAAGARRDDADIRMPEMATSSLAGVIRRRDGAPFDSGDVRVYDAHDARPAVDDPAARVGADGRFTIGDLPAGQWLVAATAAARPPAADRQSRTTQLFGTVTITTDGHRASAVTVDVDAGTPVSGSVEVIDAESGASAPQIPIYVAPTDATTRAQTVFSVPGTGGNFSIESVAPGRHVFVVNTPYRLVSLKAHGHDVIDAALDISRSQPTTGVVVTVQICRSAIAGVVRGPDGRPAPEATVVAFPADDRGAADAQRAPYTQRPSTTGRYRLFPLPAGAYLMAAVDRVDLDTRHDPAALAALREAIRATATRVEVTRGEIVVLDLTYARR